MNSKPIPVLSSSLLVEEEDDDYGGSDSSPASARDSLFSQVEIESSDTIVMPVVVIEPANLKEQLTDTLDTLSKESEEKNVQIKYQSKQIVDFTKKLEKQASKASNKGSGDEILTKEYSHSKESDNEHKPKNDSTLSSM